ncbi:DUF551 domain-containing protein [Enterobacter hormaechei subsp. xiangfangensis]|uniref:DUF551 domain-containing protein n=2 Tax=Enterobacter hormaechei TaxID=158836 RepID=UPI002075D098|nr:DUF551 domain-containing protein [Enterobacter hormaechei]MCM8295497.1 DUF551 domain-containing protein [Enterobacter hormaechei]MCM8304113.1 DUF551 domain-containing protein [Enterobacter hormaechei]MDF3798036.1 DUF551 domain-containing protein [Enterobacter hormaechei]MDF3808373.1 DUF551 domain-containing protein [Enterobacter hormaechei]
MSNIDKHDVQAVADLKAGYTLGHADVAILNELARIALASLEAEPVCVIDQSNLDYLKSGADADVWPASRTEMGDVLLYRTAPPAPVSVPAAMEMDDDFDSAFEHGKAVGWNACRAAMLQGAELVTTANKLPAEAAYGYFAFNDHHGEEFFKNREDAIAFCKEAIEEYRQENADEGCDPDEVRRTCWGIIMQEGTDIEVDNEGHIDYALTPELDGNSPAIPDGWVACSERMPKFGDYLVTDGQDFDVQMFNGEQFIPGFVWEDNITHWMPLPAAPQQEVK